MNGKRLNSEQTRGCPAIHFVKSHSLILFNLFSFYVPEPEKLGVGWGGGHFVSIPSAMIMKPGGQIVCQNLFPLVLKK